MAKMTEEEWQNLYENFETTALLDAVNEIDKTRQHLGDGENWKPPQIRTDLLRLHGLAMDVVNNGWMDNVQKLFDMAGDLEMQVDDIIESLEKVRETLSKLNELYPESLAEF